MDLDEIERRLDAGHTVAQVAASAGVTERTIRNRLHRGGRQLSRERTQARRSEQTAHGRGLLSDPGWLEEQHVEQLRTASQIARSTHTSTAEVQAALDRLAIARPSPRPELEPAALRAAFAAGETVSSIARRTGVDRAGVRKRMRRAGINNPNYQPTKRPAALDDPVWLSERYEANGLSMRQIGVDLDVSVSTVQRALVGAGIELRGRAGRLPPGGIDGDWLLDAYLTQQLPVADIAEQAAVSTSTIRRALSFHNIPDRPAVIRRPRRRAIYPPTARRPHPHANRPGGIDPDWLRIQYVRRHRTLKDIAGEVGVSVTTVHSAVKAHGLTRSSLRRHPDALHDERWLRTRYLEDNATARDIADELRLQESVVRSALRRHGINRP